MPTDYTKDGAVRFNAIIGPQDGYGIILGPDNTFKVVADPLSSAPIEAISCDTNGNVTLTGLTANGQSSTNATLTTPTLSGTVSGTYTLGGTPTITSPAISNPTLSGTATGTYTLGGTPTIASPIFSGTASGTYTLGGTPTLSSPAINSPTIASPTFSGTSAGTYTFGGVPTITGLASTSTQLIGGGTGLMTSDGTLKSNGNLQPTSTAQQIVDLYTLPANSFTGFRFMYIFAWAVHASNTNNCTLALNAGGTGIVGAIPSGGVALGTQLSAVANGVYFVSATIMRTGASQQAYFGQTQSAATAGALTGGTINLAETSPIQLNLVMTNATAAVDATAYWFIQFAN